VYHFRVIKNLVLKNIYKLVSQLAKKALFSVGFVKIGTFFVAEKIIGGLL
jgi:hypothetical protein